MSAGDLELWNLWPVVTTPGVGSLIWASELFVCEKLLDCRA